MKVHEFAAITLRFAWLPVLGIVIAAEASQSNDQLAAELERDRASVATLKVHLRTHPVDVGALVRLGELQSSLGQLDDAASVLLRAVGLEPDNPKAWSALASVQERRNQLGEAIVAYREAHHLRPGLLALVASKSRDLTWLLGEDLWVTVAIAHSILGDQALASEALERVQSLNPSKGDALRAAFRSVEDGTSKKAPSLAQTLQWLKGQFDSAGSLGGRKLGQTAFAHDGCDVQFSSAMALAFPPVARRYWIQLALANVESVAVREVSSTTDIKTVLSFSASGQKALFKHTSESLSRRALISGDPVTTNTKRVVASADVVVATACEACVGVNKEHADRIKKAFDHVAELCGATLKKEPF